MIDLKKIFYTIKNEYLKDFSKFLKWAFQNYKNSNSSLWTNTLCYFTILLFIPILAIAFSIARWFGIDSFYLNQLATSSPLNKETIDLILETTQNLLNTTRNGLLAGVGFFSLGWVIISIFSVIEKALNSIWGIDTQRVFFRKVTDYFTIFLLLPLCIVFNNILTSSFINFSIVGYFIKLISPYLSSWLFFLFFYTFLPNTKVKIKYTIVSSFFISLMLNQSNTLLLKLQILIGTYNKIYGSFSVLLLSLIWLKIIWFLILLGAHLSYILQNKQSYNQVNEFSALSFESKFRLGKLILFIFIDNYNNDEPALTLEDISQILNISIESTYKFLRQFEKLGYISKLDMKIPCYKLTKNLNKITISKLRYDMENFGLTLQF